MGTTVGAGTEYWYDYVARETRAVLMYLKKKVHAVVWGVGEGEEESTIWEVFLRRWDLGIDLEKRVGCFKLIFCTKSLQTCTLLAIHKNKRVKEIHHQLATN